MFADITEKKDGNKKFYEEFGKFVERAVLEALEGRAVCREWLVTTVLEKRSRGTRVGRMTAD